MVLPEEGIRRLNLSPKYSSLAYDEIKEHIEDQRLNLEPELNLIISKLSKDNTSSSSLPVRVGGRVTVSF